ncbi:MAG: response regulator, partial [Candidatus Margulisbacteria bacterium]|nr:response regulator [Candidatus Margulisiibacteriota bacterium]
KVLMGMGGNRIRLIFLDIKMAEMDGLQFLEKIRKDYGEEIAVTMLTAYEDAEKWDRATSGFVIRYLKKPFEPDEIVSTADDFFAGKSGKMTLDTFEEHIEKRDDLEKKAKEE